MCYLIRNQTKGTVHIAMHSKRPMALHSKKLALVGIRFKDQLAGLLQMVNQSNCLILLTNLAFVQLAGKRFRQHFRPQSQANSNGLLRTPWLERCTLISFVCSFCFVYFFFQPPSNSTTNPRGNSTVTRLHPSQSIDWIAIRLWSTSTTTTIHPTTTALLQETKPLGAKHFKLNLFHQNIAKNISSQFHIYSTIECLSVCNNNERWKTIAIISTLNMRNKLLFKLKIGKEHLFIFEFFPSAHMIPFSDSISAWKWVLNSIS